MRPDTPPVSVGDPALIADILGGPEGTFWIQRGLRRDEFDVPIIVRYRLERGAADT